MKKNESKDDLAKQIKEIEAQLKPNQHLRNELKSLEDKLAALQDKQEEADEKALASELKKDPDYIKYVKDLKQLIKEIREFEFEAVVTFKPRYSNSFMFEWGIDISDLLEPADPYCSWGDSSSYYPKDAAKAFKKEFETRIKALEKLNTKLIKKYDDLFKIAREDITGLELPFGF